MVSKSQITIHPEKTATLIIGMQNDFCHPEGTWAKQKGLDQSHVEQTIDNLLRLANTSRLYGIPIIHVALVTTSWTAWPPQREPSSTSACWVGSWGADFYRVEPDAQDRIIWRYRPSGFLETDLDLALQAKGRSTVLLAGFNGDGGALLTGADAASRNYQVLTIADGITGWSSSLEKDVMLKFIERQIGPVLSTREWIALLSAERG